MYSPFSTPNAHEYQLISNSFLLDADPTFDNSIPATTYDQFIDGELSTINTTINLNDTIMDYTGYLRHEEVSIIIPYVSTYIYFHVNTDRGNIGENNSMFLLIAQDGSPNYYDWTLDFFLDYELFIEYNDTNALIYINNNLTYVTTNIVVSYTSSIWGDYILTKDNNVTINYSYYPRIVQTTSTLTNTIQTTSTVTNTETTFNTQETTTTQTSYTDITTTYETTIDQSTTVTETAYTDVTTTYETEVTNTHETTVIESISTKVEQAFDVPLKPFPWIVGFATLVYLRRRFN